MNFSAMPRICVHNITIVQSRPSPFRLRWSIDGREKSRSFKTRGEAEKFKVRLEGAVEDGANFDPNSGLPDQWVAQFRGFASVASEFAATKWHEWSAVSRASFCDGAAVITYELIRPRYRNNYERLETHKVIRELILNQNPLKSDPRALEIKRHVIEHTYRLNEITPEIVTKTVLQISRKVNGEICATDTQRKRKQAFGAIMDFAYRMSYTRENNFKRVKVKIIQGINPIDPVKALNPQECRYYCKMLREHPNIKRGYYLQAADFLEIIWLAGLRPSEVAGLQVKHVHLFDDGKTSYIKVEQAVVSLIKGYSDDLATQQHKGLKARSKTAFRTVPILDELYPTLKKLIEGKGRDEYLFTSTKRLGMPIKTDLIHNYFRKVCKSTHTPYDLRHTNASILIYSGLNIIEVANRLGNSVEICQRVYLHMINRIEETSIDRENQYLESTKSEFEFSSSRPE